MVRKGSPVRVRQRALGNRIRSSCRDGPSRCPGTRLRIGCRGRGALGPHVEAVPSAELAEGLRVGRATAGQRRELGEQLLEAGAGDDLEAAQAHLDGARVPRLVKLEEALEAGIAEHGGGGQEPEDGAALTDAEHRVLELLPSDLTYREIADRLVLPLEAVREHGLGIRRKLRAATRDGAVSAARRLELI